MTKKINNMLQAVLPALLMVMGALLVGAVLIIISGNDPITAYAALLEGAFSNSYRISETFVKAIPLMLMALGISIAFKNQIWNIGAGGQFTIGTIFSVIVCLYFKLPPVPTMIVSFIFAFIGGALWGGLAGWLKARFNANEVITTLMLDYIATFLLAYLVYGPMMDPNGFGYPQSAVIEKVFRLPKLIVGGRLHAGLFVAIAILGLMLLFGGLRSVLKLSWPVREMMYPDMPVLIIRKLLSSLCCFPEGFPELPVGTKSMESISG